MDCDSKHRLIDCCSIEHHLRSLVQRDGVHVDVRVFRQGVLVEFRYCKSIRICCKYDWQCVEGSGIQADQVAGGQCGDWDNVQIELAGA